MFALQCLLYLSELVARSPIAEGGTSGSVDRMVCVLRSSKYRYWQSALTVARLLRAFRPRAFTCPTLRVCVAATRFALICRRMI